MTDEEAIDLAERVAAIWPTPAMNERMLGEHIEAFKPWDYAEVHAWLDELRASRKFRPSIAELIGNDGDTAWEAHSASAMIRTPEAMHWSGHDPETFRRETQGDGSLLGGGDDNA